MSELTLPTTFRVCKDVIAYRGLLQKPPRARGYHPSSMSRLCPVKQWFYNRAMDDFASDDPAKVSDAHTVVRAILDTEHDAGPGRLPARLDGDLFIGDAIHKWVQYSFGALGYLWGGWRCDACKARVADGHMPRVEAQDISGKPIMVSAPCLACRGRNLGSDTPWEYVEPGIGSAEWNVVGHCDGVFLRRWKGGEFKAALEIKSINENGYYERYGDPLPKPEHIEQASHYVWGLRQRFDWLRDLRHIYFVYVNKNAIRDWKEFAVEADEGVIERTKTTITSIREATAGPPVHLRTCEQVYAKLAIACPMVERCFGEAPPLNFFDPKVEIGEFPL